MKSINPCPLCKPCPKGIQLCDLCLEKIFKLMGERKIIMRKYEAFDGDQHCNRCKRSFNILIK
jgi:hypothetical protein